MRKIFLLGAIASTFALAACEKPAETAGEPEAAATEAAAPAGEATEAATTGEAADWAALETFVGKGPVESGLIDNSPIAGDLKTLLGEKVSVLKTNLETVSPLQKEGSVLYTSGNQNDQGGSNQAYILIDPAAKAIEVGIWEKGVLTTKKTEGSNITKPKDIETMISNSAAK